jgi:hypothetical protein
MAASYPSSTKSFTTKTDGPSQVISASHVNDLQDEVVAIENDIRTGFTNAVKAPDGTVSLPGFSFTNEPDCGVYKEGTNAIAAATAGVKALGIDSTQFIDSPTQPRCSAYNNTAQSINTATATVLALNNEDFDVGTMHDLVTNNSRVVVPTGGDGLYLVMGGTTFAANATGTRQLLIRKNGATILAQNLVPIVSAATSLVVQASQIVVLAAADYVELTAAQTSGGALDLGSAAERAAMSHLQLVKLW